MSDLGKLSRHLTLQETELLRSSMPARQLAPNATLITAGEHNESLFFVMHGELLVSLPFPSGPLFVGSRPAGTWVGEVTLLDPGPASATVSASEGTEVRELSGSTLAALTASNPSLVAHLVRALSEDLARRVRSAGVVLDEAPPKAPPGFFKSVLGRLFGRPTRWWRSRVTRATGRSGDGDRGARGPSPSHQECVRA